MRDNPNSLVNAVLQYLSLRGILAWRNNTGSARMPSGRWVAFGVKGMPDVLGCLAPHGRTLAIECKTGTGRLSKDQKAVIDNLNAAGALAFVVRSIDDVERGLKG